MNNLGFNNTYPKPPRLRSIANIVPLLVYARCYVNIVSLSAALVITVFDLPYSFFLHNLVKLRNNLHHLMVSKPVCIVPFLIPHRLSI